MKNFDEIIQTINSICVNISRSKNLQKSNNAQGKEQDMEAIYRDTISLNLNSYPSIFRNQVSCETQNKHGKADIVIHFDDSKKYVAECAVLKKEENQTLVNKIENKYRQLLYNTTDKDNKISLLFFVLKKVFDSNKIFKIIETFIEKENSEYKIHETITKYQNNDWVIKTRPTRFPEIDFFIHIGIYDFFYKVDYAKYQKPNKKNIEENTKKQEKNLTNKEL